jgi:transketolase
MRPAIRLAALMKQPVIYVFTHDSIWVGEDGPTHQPVEQMLALRAIPGLVVLRPADANETLAAWRFAIERSDGPVALLLSRQAMPTLAATAEQAATGVPRGGYVLEAGPDSPPEIVLMGTGSEVALVLEVAKRLREHGVVSQTVTMPSWELFDQQPEGYRRIVLPVGIPKLAVEAGVKTGWREYVGDDGAVVGLEDYGASAPGAVVAKNLGLQVDSVTERALALLDRS